MKVNHMTQDEKVGYLTTEPIPKLICEMSVPTIISMLVSSFYNMVDTMFVGKLNTQSTGAVGIAFAIMALIQAIGFFFGHGSGNYISRKLGAQEMEEAEKMAAVGFFLAFIAGIVLMAAGLVVIEPLAYLLGSTDTILPYTVTYLWIIQTLIFQYVKQFIRSKPSGSSAHWKCSKPYPEVDFLTS